MRKHIDYYRIFWLSARGLEVTSRDTEPDRLTRDGL